MTYDKIPSSSRFKTDTTLSVFNLPAAKQKDWLARQEDKIIQRIDALLDAYAEAERRKDENTKPVIACDLLFTADYWLRTSRSPTCQSRLPAVNALYARLADDLCKFFGTTVNVLPSKLQLMFGRELSDDGWKIDVQPNFAKYYERSEIQPFQLHFTGGLAYQWNWSAPLGIARVLKLANSIESSGDDGLYGPRGGAGTFVMSMTRDIYMRKQFRPIQDHQGNRTLGIYHSSYLAGQPVMAAGSMTIVNGKVLSAKSDSGHYKPVDSNMLALLNCLEMHGVALGGVKVIDYNTDAETNALDFLKAHGNWNELLRLSAATLADYQRWHKDRQPAPAAAPYPHILVVPPQDAAAGYGVASKPRGSEAHS